MHYIVDPRLLVITFLSLAVALCGCATGSSGEKQEYIGEAGTSGQVGDVLLTQNLRQTAAPKVIVASFRVTATGFTPTQTLVAFGAAGSVGGGGDDYRVELVGRDGRTLVQYGIWDPRKAVVERQGIVVNPEGVLAARLPFKPEAEKIRVRDKSGTIVAESDVRSVMVEFCRRLKYDPDCEKVTQSPTGPR